jgi:PRTRC genetic system protein B
MDNITNIYNEAYTAYKGIVVFKSGIENSRNFYVESFDFTADGRPINFHPLSHNESLGLAETLYPNTNQTGFLHCRGMLPKKVLYVSTAHNGAAMWYTTAKIQHLFFKESLNIPCGYAQVPALLWFATKDDLRIFALSSNGRPSETTQLYHAPFFNIYEDGDVCMGSVDINIKKDCGLIPFMEKWEMYFFKSYFSHLILSTSPVRYNITQLWAERINTSLKFPNNLLIANSTRIKSLTNAKFND